MYGAIIGDIVGSRFEFANTNSTDFKFFHQADQFTDDTVMTCAIADAVRSWHKNRSNNPSYDELKKLAIKYMCKYGNEYPNCGFGARFMSWVLYNPKPYNSCGNGAAMRVSPVAYYAQDEDDVKAMSRAVTEVSHDHPEGIKGAECTAMCIYWALHGMHKDEIRERARRYYNVKCVDEYRKENNGQHGFETCQVSVPQALACFFESNDFEECIRLSVSIGGDSDTVAAIAGGIAEAYFGIPKWMKDTANEYFDKTYDRNLLKSIRLFRS